jgi:hypothetical protein
MWACAATAAGDSSLASAFSKELLKYYEPGADYWGKSSDPDNEDTLHNEMYFDQFLAWFGASILGGVFTNLWEDLKDPNIDIVLAWKKEPQYSGRQLNADIAPYTISGVFNKYARWNVKLTHEDSSESRIFSGSGETLFVSWNGLDEKGKPMKQGWYNVNIAAARFSTPSRSRVFLSKSFDLMEGNRLIVDDFRDGDVIPFIGNTWQSYLDSYEGKSGKSSCKDLYVKTIDSKKWISWNFLLDQGNLGYDPYAALEWNCTMSDSNLNLTGVDSIIIVARSNEPLEVSVQIIQPDIGDYNYHEDSLYLTSSATEYKLPLNGFKQRFGGDAQLNLSKTTAIRFQVQLASGTENTIMINKFYFTGDLKNIYTPPPGIIPISVKLPFSKKSNLDIVYSITAGGISFKLPEAARCREITIVDIAGKVVSRSAVKGLTAFISLPDSFANKIYLAQFKMENGVYMIPLAKVR